jgi:argininosuccinate lyase
MKNEDKLEHISTVGGRLKAGPGGSYRDFIHAPRFEKDRFEKFDAIIITHKAWTLLLTESGCIPERDAAKIFGSLFDLEKNGPDALGPFIPELEDLYMHVERYLASIAGPETVGKFNYGRTRPEPINRLVGRERILASMREIIDFYEKMLDKAANHLDMIMPGYTHMQQAQPMTVSHYLIGVADMVERSIEDFQLAFKQMNLNSIGSGALAGTHDILDRKRITELLSFDGIVENSYDAVSSADHFARTAGAAATLASGLSRVAQDFNLWSTREYNYVYVDDQYAAQSSMMPQKRNAVSWEFIRARAARVTGTLMDVLGIIHNTYFADVCDTCIETSGPTWESLDILNGTVRLLGDVIASSRFNKDRMLEIVTNNFATVSELSELIRQKTGGEYRTTHMFVGQMVQRLLDQGKNSQDLNREFINTVAEETGFPAFEISDAEIKKAIDPVEFIKVHNALGGTAPVEGKRMIGERLDRLKNFRRWVEQKTAYLKDGKQSLDDLIRSKYL